MSQRARRQATTAATLPLGQRRSVADDRLPAEETRALRPRRPGVRWRWGRYLVLGTAAYCCWLGHGEWVAYHRLAAERAALTAQVTQLKAQQASLQAAVSYAGSDAYIRSQAMQLFGMVGQGQVSLAPMPPTH